MEKVKKNPWVTLAKVILILILVVALIFGGIFAFIKIKYDINIFTTIKQLKAFGKEPNVEKIVSYPFDNDTLDAGLLKLDNVGLSSIYTKDGSKVTFDLENIENAVTINAELSLSDAELGAIVNAYFNSIMNSILSEDEQDLLGTAEVVQIKISNVENLAGGMTSAHFNIIAKVDMGQFKSMLTAFPLSLIKDYVPQTLYINATSKLTMTGNTMYTANYVDLKLNNLSTKQTNELVKLLDKFLGIGSAFELGKSIGDMVGELLIGNADAPEGIVYSLSKAGAKSCGFRDVSGVGHFYISTQESVV